MILMTDFTVASFTLILICVISFFSGIGITTIGPGGIFVTIALYTLTAVPSNTVAGTAHATFIATGLVASAAYIHSGEMKTDKGCLMAVILSISSIIGAFSGAYINSFVSRSVFGLLLGVIATATGVNIVYREWRGFSALYQVDLMDRQDQIILCILGFALGIVSGLLGVGGPVLAVPVLILIGVPMLLAVAVAQVQSVFIAAFATAGYLSQGNVSFSLTLLVGFPLLAGVLVGWKIAHMIHPDKLKVTAGVALIAVGPYIAM